MSNFSSTISSYLAGSISRVNSTGSNTVTVTSSGIVDARSAYQNGIDLNTYTGSATNNVNVQGTVYSGNNNDGIRVSGSNNIVNVSGSVISTQGRQGINASGFGGTSNITITGTVNSYREAIYTGSQNDTITITNGRLTNTSFPTISTGSGADTITLNGSARVESAADGNTAIDAGLDNDVVFLDDNVFLRGRIDGNSGQDTLNLSKNWRLTQENGTLFANNATTGSRNIVRSFESINLANGYIGKDAQGRIDYIIQPNASGNGADDVQWFNDSNRLTQTSYRSYTRDASGNVLTATDVLKDASGRRIGENGYDSQWRVDWTIRPDASGNGTDDVVWYDDNNNVTHTADRSYTKDASGKVLTATDVMKDASGKDIGTVKYDDQWRVIS